MGCGASSEAEAAGGKKRGSPESPTKAIRRTYSKADTGNGNGRRGSHGETVTPPPADPGVLSQALLADLRTKGASNNVPVRDALSRWVENICSPADGDNPDLYDPVRRHRLCMDSVEAKKKSARVANVSAPSTSTTPAQGGSGGSVYDATGASTTAPSVADSEAGVSEDKSAPPLPTAATEGAKGQQAAAKNDLRASLEPLHPLASGESGSTKVEQEVVLVS